VTDELKADISCDRNYVDGLNRGFVLGLENANEQLQKEIEGRMSFIREAARASPRVEADSLDHSIERAGEAVQRPLQSKER
jgi:hypothetical protein